MAQRVTFYRKLISHLSPAANGAAISDEHAVLASSMIYTLPHAARR
jgi:hypothetical protein